MVCLLCPAAEVGRGSADCPPEMLLRPESEVREVDSRMRFEIEAGELMMLSFESPQRRGFWRTTMFQLLFTSLLSVPSLVARS